MSKTARKWLTVMTLAVGGGLLVSAAPAHASVAGPPVAAQVSGVTAVPAVVGSKGRICLKNSSSYCLESNGIGHQVTITNSNYSVFTVVRLIHDIGYSEYQWENASGNCLRAGPGTGLVVIIKNGGCSDGDEADWWEFNQNNVENEYYGLNHMLVRGQPANGSKVFDYATVESGDWSKWNAPG